MIECVTCSRVDAINNNKPIVRFSDLSLFHKINFFNPLLYRSRVIQLFYFSGTFPASEYLFSAPRGLFISVVIPRFRVSAQRLEDSCRTPRGLFILVVLSLLPSICAAPQGFYLVEFEYLRKVLVHGLIYAILSTCAKG